MESNGLFHCSDWLKDEARICCWVQCGWLNRLEADKLQTKCGAESEKWKWEWAAYWLLSNLGSICWHIEQRLPNVPQMVWTTALDCVHVGSPVFAEDLLQLLPCYPTQDGIQSLNSNNSVYHIKKTGCNKLMCSVNSACSKRDGAPLVSVNVNWNVCFLCSLMGPRLSVIQEGLLNAGQVD